LFIADAPVEKVIELEHDIFLLQLKCKKIASVTRPGEFVNVKVTETVYPLLRRPFSICDVEGDYIYLMFNIFGEGTKMLAQKKKGDTLDLLGPLGKGFSYDDDFDTAVIVAGGLGAAPFPFLTRRLKDEKKMISFIGGRTLKDVITHGLQNIHIATDDGSKGLKGNVVDLLRKNLDVLKKGKIKIFGCGPNAMLRVLKEFCLEHDFNCEVSTECAMACGFGICQGCPIESTSNPDQYLLVCKDGPVFNIKDVVI
jgi:dihydroorotate dehydrogenase electron transfer subunit